MNIQYITDEKGVKTHVMMPLDEFESLIDNRDFDAAINDDGEVLSDELVTRLLNGDNKIKVWRNYRGLTQQQVADIAEISIPYLSMLESGKRAGNIDTLKKLADVLTVDMEDLV